MLNDLIIDKSRPIDSLSNYSQSDLGQNPTVNLATGRLRYTFDDLSIDSGNFAINVAHVYVSNLHNTFAQKFKMFGSKWKLNLSQCIISARSCIVYLDELGEAHRFIKFDGNRYYDERNAKTTLVYNSGGESVITDGVGNKLYFNSNGLLCKSVSCHNDKILKLYNYDESNRLYSVYDKRNFTPRLRTAASRILFDYNADGLLSSMTSYIGVNVKHMRLNYQYDANGNLTGVEKEVFAGQKSASKQMLELSYDNNRLTMVTDSETGSAQKFEFENSLRVAKVTQGVSKYSGLSIGAKDAAAAPIAFGATELGALAAKTFTPLKYNVYSYDFSLSSLSVKTEITNENGVTLAYFIDRNACITSSFEKVGDNLKTLTKQGAKHFETASSGSFGYINGNATKKGSSVGGTIAAPFDIARSKLEESCQRFTYSFWLKTENAYDTLEAKITYKLADTETSATVYLDPEAKCAWQKVSLPIDLNGHKTNELKYLQVSLLANKALCADEFYFNDIGFAPAPHTDLLLAYQQGNFSLQSVDKVNYTGVSESISKDLYFTESDVIATFTNKFKNKPLIDFDIICNNGTKRIKTHEIRFGAGDTWTVESDSPCRTVIYMPNGQYTETIFCYNYPIEHCDVLQNIVTVNQSQIDNSFTEQEMSVMDYCGNVLLERDPYGVRKKYSYDEYGNIVKVQIVGSDNVLGSAINYYYDTKGRLTQVNDGLTGRQFFYDNCGQLDYVTDGVMSNGTLQSTSHKVEYGNGIFKDKRLYVSDNCGGDQIAKNTVTYENGRIRTVTDGTVKYGIKHDVENNAVEYTQFNGGVETALQKDSISPFANNLQTHKSEFFGNGRLNACTSAYMDKYGKTVKLDKRNNSDNASETYVYQFKDISESQFANEPAKLILSDGTVTDYNRDADGNLVNVALHYPNADQSESYKLICGIQQVEENTTRYMFEDDSNQYFSSIVTDPKRTSAPRIDSVKNMWYRHALTDYKVKDYPLYCQQFTYDNFGRLKSSNNSGYYTCGYEYLNSTSMLKKVTYRNNMPLQQGMGSAGSADVKQDESLSYYPNGSLKSVEQSYSFNVHNIKSNGVIKNEYSYDDARRLTRHVSTKSKNNTLNTVTTNYSYRSDGRLQQIVKNGSSTQSDGKTNTYSSSNTYTYNKLGQLTSFSDGTTFSYDAYGNRTSKNNYRVNEHISYSYKYGSMLSKITSNGTTSEYKYNADGIRFKKTVNGVETKYYLDGSKILRESGKNTITYFYGRDGLLGFRIGSDEYTYVRDSQGNVTMLFSVDKTKAIARYEYDTFGSCTVYDGEDKINTSADFIGNVNPFRWKGFYFDAESGLYYANGSYYDPQVGMYVDASPLPAIADNALTTHCLDRNAPLCNNILELANNPSNAYSETDLSTDPNYDFENSLPDWLIRRRKRQEKLAEALKWYQDLHWGWKLGIGIALLIGAIAFTLASGEKNCKN